MWLISWVIKFMYVKSFVNIIGERNNGKLIVDWVNMGL